MKKVVGLILTITLTFSCASNDNNSTPKQEVPTKTTYKDEKFKEISSDNLNQLLTHKQEVLSAKEVMILFYPKEVNSSEGNEKIEISEKTIGNGNVIVTLIHDHLLDDSIKAEKYIMELTKRNDKWIVLSIKKNWKCWDSRGHSSWGTELCS